MPYRSVFRPALFNGHTVVVTGGGSGIGRCTAHELAALGANVVLLGRNRDKLERCAQEIIDDGGIADFDTADIRDEARVHAVVAAIVAKHGKIDGLVNNAGGQFPAPLAAISQNGFEAVVRTNLVGGFLVAREVFTQSMTTNGGAIVNIVADMWNGMPGMGHSGAARAGMVNLTKTAAFEWAPAGVRVNAVAPGWVASSGLDTYDDSVRAIIPNLKDAVPMRRLATEAEISAAICFLLSEAAAFISGTTLAVDGGAPLGSSVWPHSSHAPTRAFDGFHRGRVPKALESTDLAPGDPARETTPNPPKE